MKTLYAVVDSQGEFDVEEYETRSEAWSAQDKMACAVLDEAVYAYASGDDEKLKKLTNGESFDKGKAYDEALGRFMNFENRYIDTEDYFNDWYDIVEDETFEITDITFKGLMYRNYNFTFEFDHEEYVGLVDPADFWECHTDDDSGIEEEIAEEDLVDALIEHFRLVGPFKLEKMEDYAHRTRLDWVGIH
jgi:hypothetical protein